jgi:hypothetical protein
VVKNIIDQLSDYQVLNKKPAPWSSYYDPHVYDGFKYCPSSLENIVIRVPTQNFRDFPLFTVGSSHKSCPSARCASAKNIVCRDTNISI